MNISQLHLKDRFVWSQRYRDQSYILLTSVNFRADLVATVSYVGNRMWCGGTFQTEVDTTVRVGGSYRKNEDQETHLSSKDSFN